MNRVRLGPFDVLEKIANGGMGDVWRGVHSAQGIPVAIKVLRPLRTNQAGFRAAFRREVRAIAQLDHPGITTILDIGEIPEATARASQGRMAAHSPYLVMEYLERGSLGDADGPVPWTKTREILLGVLDGLAHAHARGITHLDIKPGNILLAGKPEGFPVRLTDFGIAVSMRERLPAEGHTDSGTPMYMAPEQFFDEWRDFGPWTDLYALGCVAYQLCSGRPPFDYGDVVQIGAAHINEPPPALACPADYPSGFDQWVLRLLAKNPGDRYQRCAGAAAALVALTANNPTVARDAPAVTGCRAADRAMELERTWRGETPPPRPFKLIGAGLELFSLRTVPMIGRDAERERLWQSFQGVVSDGRGGVVVVEGPAGVGKSRLASWFCERLHELDIADCLISEGLGSRHREAGLSYMLAKAWACLELTGPELRLRVAGRLTQAGIASQERHDAIAELLAPASLGSNYQPGMFHSFPSRGARDRILLDVLEQVYDGRPVVVWLDDANWDADALGFVRSALTAGFPLMVVLTIRDDLAADSTTVSELLRDLALQENARCLRLGPLSDQESLRLVNTLLYLDGDLAQGVARRAGGNPLYATELVGDWVNRGILNVGANGFVLSTPEAPAIPDDLHALWAQRLERVLDECTAGESRFRARGAQRLQVRILIELAAALGDVVNMDEWRLVSAAVGVPDPEPVLERLLASRMARADSESWSFSHTMLGDSVERIAREHGRWIQHNRLCADMLEAHRPAPYWGDSERIGRHRFTAGQFAAALRPLLTGAKERMRMEDYSAALELLSLHQRTLDALKAPVEDARRAHGWLLQADIHCLREELAEAEDLATRVTAAPRRSETLRVHGEARLILARVQHRQGRWSAAIHSYKDAENILRTTGPKLQLATGLSEQAHTMLELGHVTAAWESLHEAQQIFEDAAHFIPWVESQLGMARVVSRLGDYGHAVALCQRVLAYARRDGLTRIEASACVALAEVQREHGDRADGEASLERGIQLFDQLGFTRQALSARASRILLLLESGKWSRAAMRADELTGVPELEVSRVSRLLMRCVRLVLAVDGPRAFFDRRIDQVTAGLAEVEQATPDMVRCLRVAAERAASGRTPRRRARITDLHNLIVAREHGATFRASDQPAG